MALAQLAVFVRPPITGEVKTRLAGLFGERGVVELYRAFVEDTLRLCARVQAAGKVDVALWSSGPDDSAVTAWAKQIGGSVHLQPEGDLGAKLEMAFDEGLHRYERTVVIGSDAPTLPVDLIGAAFDALERAPLVLGPANDGGYYAIGATNSARPRFENIRWSSVHTTTDTKKANARREVATLAPWYDVDQPEDLAILRAHLSVDPAAAPATARCLESLPLKDMGS